MLINVHLVGRSLLASRQLLLDGPADVYELQDDNADAGDSSNSFSFATSDGAEDDGALEGGAGWMERRRVSGQ